MRVRNGFPAVALAAALGVAAYFLVPKPSDKAWFLLRDGNPVAALSMAEAALAEAPSDDRAARILAMVEMHLGDTDGAEAALRRRIEDGAGSHSAIHDLARHHISMGRPLEAMELLLTLPVQNLALEEQRFVAGWLRATRNVEGELGFLGRLWDAEMLDDAGGARYAALLAVSGLRAASLAVYQALDQNGALLDPIAQQEFQLLLLQTNYTKQSAGRATEQPLSHNSRKALRESKAL
jgi:hypothetical protein